MLDLDSSYIYSNLKFTFNSLCRGEFHQISQRYTISNIVRTTSILSERKMIGAMSKPYNFILKQEDSLGLNVIHSGMHRAYYRYVP